MSAAVSQPTTTFDVALTCDRCGLKETTYGVTGPRIEDALLRVVNQAASVGWSQEKGNRCPRCVTVQSGGWQ